MMRADPVGRKFLWPFLQYTSWARFPSWGGWFENRVCAVAQCNVLGARRNAELPSIAACWLGWKMRVPAD